MLQACVECRGRGSGGECSPGNPAKDGQGVPSTDFVLYISANQSQCPKDSEATVLAFASACQLEASQDRPIAGYINFCPTALKDTDNAYVYCVAKHEMLHALAFSSQLFPYWRHQNGEPRTLRISSGEPPNNDSDSPVADSSMVKTLTYNSWRTAGTGPVQHTVTALVTEAILREGRAHFGYPELQGVELENQGGDGTALQHWEKRLLGNEAMTGVFTFDPVFSRLSLAVMEDSGWYSVNYSSASPLLWGRGKGRSFVEEGCGNLVEDTHDERNPFCGVHKSSNRLGCTLGRGAVAQCNRVTFTSQLHPGFQYFEGSPRDGGELQVTDFCPMYRAFTYQSGAGTNCSDPANQQVTQENVRAEKYGPGSRCMGQGREWKTISGGFVYSSSQFGGGCYEVYRARTL
jgi:leishmanolysin-like peptidase